MKLESVTSRSDFSEALQNSKSSIFDNFEFTFTAPLLLNLPIFNTNSAKSFENGPFQLRIRFESNTWRPSREHCRRKTVTSRLVKQTPRLTFAKRTYLESLPTEILINIMEFCDTLDTVGCLNKYFRNLVHNKLVLARWGLRQLGLSQALTVTIAYWWGESDDKTGGLELVRYMVNSGADICCGDNAIWLLKLLEVGKYRLLESVLSHYKTIFFGEASTENGNRDEHQNENGENSNGQGGGETEDYSQVDPGVRKTIRGIAHAAVYKGDPAASVITFLIGKGYKSDYALSKFVQLGNHSVVNFILNNKHKAPLKKEEMKLAINFFRHHSSRRGDLDMIRLFLYHRIITIDEDGRSPEYPSLLAEAILYQNPHVFDYLVDHGLRHVFNGVQTFRKAMKSSAKNGEHILIHLYRKGFINIQSIPAEEQPSQWYQSHEWMIDRVTDFPQLRSILRFFEGQGGTLMYLTWDNPPDKLRTSSNQQREVVIDHRILIRLADQRLLNMQIALGQMKRLDHSTQIRGGKAKFPDSLNYRVLSEELSNLNLSNSTHRRFKGLLYVI